MRISQKKNVEEIIKKHNMGTEEPSNIIRSWNLQSSFGAGAVTEEKLVPRRFGRARTPYVCVWREEQLNSILDFGSQNFSIYMPESLRVLKECYLKIQVPEAPSALKKFPGLYFIKSIRLLSAGQEVYTADYRTFLTDHMQQMLDRESTQFGTVYLGHETNMTASARTVILPILLPNSPYLLREGKDQRGHGVWPAYLGSNRLEMQITMRSDVYPSADGTSQVPSLSGKCSMLYRECRMTPSNILSFSDARGSYSVINRRFTELTSGFESAAANTEVSWNINSPQGVVTEIFFEAYPTNANEATFAVQDIVRPTKLRCVADAITQKNLDSAEKVEIELYENGFESNGDFPQFGRICFSNNAANNSHTYAGGYNQSLASTVTYFFQFAAAVKYKIFAVQLQRCRIDSIGRVSAKLD